MQHNTDVMQPHNINLSSVYPHNINLSSVCPDNINLSSVCPNNINLSSVCPYDSNYWRARDSSRPEIRKTCHFVSLKARNKELNVLVSCHDKPIT